MTIELMFHGIKDKFMKHDFDLFMEMFMFRGNDSSFSEYQPVFVPKIIICILFSTQ